LDDGAETSTGQVKILEAFSLISSLLLGVPRVNWLVPYFPAEKINIRSPMKLKSGFTIAKWISVGWGGPRSTEVAQGDPLRRVKGYDVGREKAYGVKDQGKMSRMENEAFDGCEESS
jgi:hypothetical protein